MTSPLPDFFFASKKTKEWQPHIHRKSIAISAQLPVAKWHDVFEDATIADAMLDRVVNNSYRIELKGPSLRHHNSQTEGGDITQKE